MQVKLIYKWWENRSKDPSVEMIARPVEAAPIHVVSNELLSAYGRVNKIVPDFREGPQSRFRVAELKFLYLLCDGYVAVM